MKNTSIFFILFLWSIALISQTIDTTYISISQEDAPLEKQQFSDGYRKLFNRMDPTHWLFTLSPSTVSTSSEQQGIRIGTEVKILPAISLHAAYDIGNEYLPLNSLYDETSIFNQRISLASRWYYTMPRRIRQGKSANNVSGNYIALEAAYVRTNSKIGPIPVVGFTSGDISIVGQQRSLALRYGVQQILCRYAFLDVGFGLGILKEQRTALQTPHQDNWHLFASSHISFGMALSRPRPKRKAASNGYCDVLRCFREEQQMWKIDLFNLVRINSLDEYKGQVFIGYERKIGTSPFSLEIQGEGSHTYLHTAGYENFYERTERRNSYKGTLQSRYYYTKSGILPKVNPAIISLECT